MTKKDYIRIVEDLRSAVCDAVVSYQIDQHSARVTARRFARMFARTEADINPLFNAEQFYAAVEKAIGA